MGAPVKTVIELSGTGKDLSYHVYARADRIHLGTFTTPEAAQHFADGFNTGLVYAGQKAKAS